MILMDIDLPRMNGMEASKTILSIKPDSKIAALTSYDRSELTELDSSFVFHSYLKITGAQV